MLLVVKPIFQIMDDKVSYLNQTTWQPPTPANFLFETSEGAEEEEMGAQKGERRRLINT